MMHKSERHFPRNNSFDLNFFPWTNAERNANNSFLYRDSKFDMHITNKTEIVFPIVHIYMLQSLSRIVSRLFKISHPYIYSQQRKKVSLKHLISSRNIFLQEHYA